MKANKTINNIHNHLNSMMKVSAKYGKKMGTMGTEPFNSSTGSKFARRSAEMMSGTPDEAYGIMGAIMDKAKGAGMSKEHMGRMNEVKGRIYDELFSGKGWEQNTSQGPTSLKWL